MSNFDELFDSNSEQSHESFYISEDNNYLEYSNICPTFNLPEIIIQTDDQIFDILYKNRCKAYRWRNEWKERATGEIKILRHKTNFKIRIIMRQDFTKKLMINFLLEEDPLCILRYYKGSNRIFYILAYDFSDGQGRLEKILFKFQTVPSNI